MIPITTRLYLENIRGLHLYPHVRTRICREGSRMQTPESRAGLHAVQISPTAPGPLKPVTLEATEISSGGGTEPVFTVVDTEQY